MCREASRTPTITPYLSAAGGLWRRLRRRRGFGQAMPYPNRIPSILGPSKVLRVACTGLGCLSLTLRGG